MSISDLHACFHKDANKRIRDTSLQRCHECFSPGTLQIGNLLHADSADMKADIFTKPFLEPAKWEKSVQHLGIKASC